MSVKDIGLMYDEQFNRKIKLAKVLLKNLRDKKETELALKWLVRVSNIKSPIVKVKENRNAFLSYIIKILQNQTSRSFECKQPSDCNPNTNPAFMDQFNEYPIQHTETVPDKSVNATTVKFHSKWSVDHSTYMAVKPIPGRGTLIYMAVSRKPGRQNWNLQKLYELNDY